MSGASCAFPAELTQTTTPARPVTIAQLGRTHQIRVHANYLRHPIFADDLYSGDERQIKSIHLHYQKFAKSLLKYIKRQALHAYELHLKLYEKDYVFRAPFKDDMKNLIPEDIYQELFK